MRLPAFAALLVASSFALSVEAQEAGKPRAVRPEQTSQVRIVRVTPSDTGAASTLVTVTFDRPIATALTSAIEARTVMSLEPAIAGVFDWRDLSTLRFIPDEPLAPETKLVLSIDTAAIATSGARHGELAQISVQFHGARPLAMMVETHPANPDWATGPLPSFRVLYSTAVNLDSVASRSKLVFPSYCGGTVALRAVRQRTLVKGEGKALENAGGFERDTVGDRFRRVVDLEPLDSLRPNCLGTWHVASFDRTRPQDGWQYGIRTAPPFTVKSVEPCLLKSASRSSACEPDGLSIIFSAQVAADEFTRHVRVSPQVSAVPNTQDATTIFQVPAQLVPHQRYAVSIDSTMHDVYGRLLSGPYTFVVTAGERADADASAITRQLEMTYASLASFSNAFNNPFKASARVLSSRIR